MSDQQINDGGPAFPETSTIHNAGTADEVQSWASDYGRGGMSLRDYFAAKALQAFLSITNSDGDGYTPPTTDEDYELDQAGTYVKNGDYYYTPRQLRRNIEDEEPRYKLVTTHEQRLAREAYTYADAMLAERQKGGA